MMKEFFNFIIIQKLKVHYPQYPKENIFSTKVLNKKRKILKIKVHIQKKRKKKYKSSTHPLNLLNIQ